MFKPNLGVGRGVIYPPVDFALTLIWVGFLVVHFEGGRNYPLPCLKVVRIIQET